MTRDAKVATADQTAAPQPVDKTAQGGQKQKTWQQILATRALRWMAVGVAAFMALPLFVWAGVRDTSPFLFVAVWYAVGAVIHALLRQTHSNALLKQKNFKKLLEERPECQSHGRPRVAMFGDLRGLKDGSFRRERFWPVVIFNVDSLLFALAISLVGAVVTTVVYQFWPLFFGLFALTANWKNKMPSAEQEISPSSGLMLLGVGGVSVAFAVVSDAEAADWSATTALGLSMAILSVISTALLSGFLQLIGQDLAVDQGDAEGNGQSDARGNDQDTGNGQSDAKDNDHELLAANLQTAVSTSGSAAARVVLVPVIALVGVIVAAVGASDWMTASGLLFAVAAAVAHAVGNWCFAYASSLANRSSRPVKAQIMYLYYLLPVGALLLLAGFADIAIEHFDLLIVGVSGVVVVNMALKLDPEGARQRANRSGDHGYGGHGYKALVLTLWAAGAVVLLRDDWVPDRWQVWSVVEYWGMVGVCATVFTLILSFRQSRLAERRRDMDALMLRLYRQFELLDQHGDLPKTETDDPMDLLRKVDTARHPSELSGPYLKLHKLLVDEIRRQTDRERTERLTSLLSDVEVLVNLRQQGRNFTELAVLTMFAALTATLAIAARPIAGAEPFAAWVHDTTSLVIAAAFAFLGFDLIDKRREADAPTLREVSRGAIRAYGQPKGWRLELTAYFDTSTERAAAGLMGTLLLVGTVAMLGVKWL